MPLGEIKVRVLTDQETRWREHWKTFEGREFVSIAPDLRLMSRKEFFAFMYFIDPRLALVMSQEPILRDVVAYQRDKWLIQELRDYVWRKLNDWQNSH